MPPLEFIEETVILGEDIIDPGSSIELTVTNSESPFINTESPETPIAAVVVEVEKEEKQKHVTADDIKLYLLVQRLLNETPLIDGYAMDRKICRSPTSSLMISAVTQFAIMQP